MSERTFRRAFAEETGETPREFVERIRIDAARSLFEEAQLPVQAVATRCGFETVDNLRRAFLRRLGVTPQQYRQRFRLADDDAGARRSGGMAKLAGKPASLAGFVATRPWPAQSRPSDAEGRLWRRSAMWPALRPLRRGVLGVARRGDWT